MTARLLELGSYVAPAHGGMLLAERGYRVEKWTTGVDPIRRLRDGERLWDWYTAGKTVIERHTSSIMRLAPGVFAGVIDNHSGAAWARWGVDPDREAARLGVPWVSIVSDIEGRSFDVIAQARAFGPDCPPIPFFIGDTCAGLTAAFLLTSALAAGATGRIVMPQAAALAKLREGDLAVRPPAGGWDDPADYRITTAGAVVHFRGELLTEPLRDDPWRRRHLTHTNGRLALDRNRVAPLTSRNAPVE